MCIRDSLKAMAERYPWFSGAHLLLGEVARHNQRFGHQVAGPAFFLSLIHI